MDQFPEQATMGALLLREPVESISDADLASLFSELAKAVSARFLKGKTCLSSWNVVQDYLRAAMGFEAKEQFRVLYLDKRNNLIADEILHQGTVDHVPVYPREVAHRALNLGATALIIAHNHPSGDPTPSAADISMTKTLVETLKGLGIVIHDHIIVGKAETLSFRAKGLM